MVHVTTPRPNLGAALGQGLGIGVSQGLEETRNTNKLRQALANADKIYSDPNMNPQQKQSGLLSALAPHPEIAKQYLGQFNEQQKMQQQKQQQQQALRAIEQQRGLQPGALSGLEGQENVAAAITKPQSAPGGLTGQSVPPEISMKANDILKSNPTANSDQLKLKMDEAGIPPIYSNGYVENRRRQDESKASLNEKKELDKIKRHNDLSSEVISNVNKLAESIPQRKSALELSKNAILNKDLSFWTKDNLAEITGVEGLRSPEGAIFKTAGKEYFLGSIQRAGARPNQWVEQQISDMLTKVGRSTEANLSVTRALENELDLDTARVEITNRLANELEDKLGYVPRDLGERVQKELSAFAEDKQKELYNDLRAYAGIGEKKILSFGKVKEGTPVSKTVAKALLIKNKNDPKKAAQEAKELGYAF